MITIDIERCTGCGACIEICPSGALYLVDGKAAVENTLCRECDACLDACATEAIALAPQLEPAGGPTHLPAKRPEPEVIWVRSQSAAVPLRAKVLPALGAALAWAGREIVPRVVDILLDAHDRQATRLQAPAKTRGRETRSPGTRGGGRQHRHRQRGGGG